MVSDRLWGGIDLGYDQVSICITDDDGEIVLEGDFEARPQVVLEALQALPVDRIEAIAAEAGSGAHLVRQLRANGLPIAVLEARKASKILNLRRNKTDTNDARGLADIARFGNGPVSLVHQKSAECRGIRTQLVLRHQLIKHRVAGEQVIRATLREHGVKARPAYKSSSFRPAINEALAELSSTEGVHLEDDILPLVSVCESIRIYCEAHDRRLRAMARAHPICGRFLDIPGVGPICALSFYSAIDDASRFTRTEDVAAFLGLTPRTRESGKVRDRPRISKMGNALTRCHLTQAAEVLLSVCRQESLLRSQALALKERVGFRKARIAVARKLSIVMLSLWKSGAVFDPQFAGRRIG